MSGGLDSIKSQWSEVAQLCPTLCDPMDCSLLGSSVHGIFQAIVLEWIAISFSRGSSQPRDRTQVSRIVDRRFTIWATRDQKSRVQIQSTSTKYSWVAPRRVESSHTSDQTCALCIGSQIRIHWTTREVLTWLLSSAKGPSWLPLESYSPHHIPRLCIFSGTFRSTWPWHHIHSTGTQLIGTLALPPGKL